MCSQRCDGQVSLTFHKAHYGYVDDEEQRAPGIARAIVRVFNPASVIDLGCGMGLYIRELGKLGVRVRGYDNSRYAVDNSLAGKGTVYPHDLRDLLRINRKYDLCLCVEVGEHLERRFAGRLVRNATGVSDTVWWTAAPPGQGGNFHINMQYADWWERVFNAVGFVRDRGLTEAIKGAVKEEVPDIGNGYRMWSSCIIYVRGENNA